jgi:cytochrome b561
LTNTPLAEAKRSTPAHDGVLLSDQHYDGATIIFHWLTALIVLTLFSLAHIWDFFPHDGPAQITMQTVHVSLGVILAAVLAFRVVWRFTFVRRLPPATSGLMEIAARGMHSLLYVLLLVMVVAGFGKRWGRQHAVEFFGFNIPSPVVLDPAWRPASNWAHHWGAWAIITLAGLHAVAALFHHLIVRDGVLKRMLPSPRASGD